MLDGRRRHDIRLTLILDPDLALLCWVHYAPPLNDTFRVSYRQFLHWNDELPFVKFALADDERPVLVSEVPVATLDRDTLGLALSRLLAVCDLLLDESLRWLFPGAKEAPVPSRQGRNDGLLDRYAVALGELSQAAASGPAGAS